MARGRLARLVESHPLPAWLYDAETLRFLDVNKAMVTFSGYTRRQLLRMKVADVCSIVAERRTLSRSGTPAHWRLRPTHGKTMDVRSAARRVKIRSHDAVLVIAHGITQGGPRKPAEAKQAQRTVELQAFYDLSRRLRTAQAVEEMYPVVVEHTRSLLRAFHGCLALLNPEHQVFTRVYTVGIVTEKTGSTFPSHGTRSGRVAGDGTPLVSADFSRERVPKWMESGPYRALGALAVVPVTSDEEIIGTLCVARVKGAAAFTDAELHLLGGIA